MINKSKTACKFAQVIVPCVVRGLFTYSVPESLLATATPGKRVLVPFGARKLIGLIARRVKETDIKTKPLLMVIDEEPVTPPDLLELGLWSADHYFAPAGDILGLIAPKDDVRIVAEVRLIPETGPPGARSKKLMAIHQALAATKDGTRKLDLLAKDLDVTAKELAKTVKGQTAKKHFALSEQARTVNQRTSEERAPFKEPVYEPVTLTSAQERGANTVLPDIKNHSFRVHLIHGVTGSGKTEVYAQLIRKTLDAGYSALALAPEIALADMLALRLEKRLGVKPLVIHSDMTPKERHLKWGEARKGKAQLVVGARSAVFAPISDLGLIVVDEEHDQTYKQDSSPRYNGRDVAIKRGSLANSPVVLGSATPSLESFHNALKGKYGLIEMRERIDNRPMPQVEVIKPEKAGELSERLKHELSKRLTAKEQSLIFINRRGAARYIQCRVCSHTFECPNCSLTLIYHLTTRSLLCHTCAYTEPLPEVCPKCSSPDFYHGGQGSQRVEKELGELFPCARVLRMDRDTTRKRRSSAKILEAVDKGEVDILIGTQMVTKGHDYPGITLVAAVSADDTLRIPDFRAGERTFQLITQSAGRAGRGDTPGLVLVQTLSGEHHSIQSAANHDFRSFYEIEAPLRELVGYPPFVRLAFIRIDTQTEAKGAVFMNRMLPMLNRLGRDAPGVIVMGPVEALVFKTKNRFNWRILLKAHNHGQLSKAINLFLEVVEALDNVHKSGVNIVVDMDPVSGM